MGKYLYDFSFVVPVYNCEKYISECIESILKQKYDTDRIQLILINDGSTDNSLEICNNYKRDNVIIIDQKNKGVSFTRNTGIKKSSGKYIAFLDSDDFISENYCKEVFECFEKNQEIDLVATNLLNYNAGKITGHFRYSKIYPKENSIIDINKAPSLIQTTINVCIRNNIKDQALFDYTMKFSEDEKFNTEIILKTGKYGYCPNAKYYYRKSESSITKVYNIETKEFQSYTNYYIELFKKYGNNSYVKNLFLNTLRWRINESKLITCNNTDINVIKKILKNINGEDIIKLEYLSLPIIFSILELKELKYSIIYDQNKFIISIGNTQKDFTNKCHFSISKLSYDKVPVIQGKFNFPLKNLEYRTNSFEFLIERINLYEASGIKNVFEYNYTLKIKKIPCEVSLDFIENNFNLKYKNKSYGLKYIITIVNNHKILINKITLKDKIKKIKHNIFK